MLKAFRRDEDGGITIFVVILFLLMVVGTGMAVDFMRQETARADLQNALDRGVLAAASKTQTVAVDDDGDGDLDDEYQQLVAEYMASRSFKAPLTLTVDHTQTLSNKRIEANARYDLPTHFLRLIGYDTLPVPAYAVAQQANLDTEISLVFDVSGSMVSNNVTVNGQTTTRLARAKTDAKAFVAYMLDQDPTGTGTTISLVPYSAKVAVPQGMAALYNLQPVEGAPSVHNYSYCFDFDVADYKVPGLTTAQAVRQFPHFKDGNGRWGCPRAENQILPFSSSKDDLEDAIDGLTSENWTAVYEGVKWGAILLDEGTRDITPGLISANLVDSGFSHVPRNYNEPNKVKALVVMSDGNNTNQPIMTGNTYNGTPGQPRGAAYWDNRDSSSSYGSGNCSRGNQNGRYAKYSSNCNLAAINPPGNAYGVGAAQLSLTTRTEYAPGQTVTEPDAILFEICDRAKERGIVIYTIGFELTADSAGGRALKECASSIDKFYPVSGLNLADAFQSIAADIQNLKLTN